MNLVMVGRFEAAVTAETVKGVIERLTEAVEAEVDAGRLTVGEPLDSYSDEILKLLLDLEVHSLSPGQLEQFLYDVRVNRDGDSVVITTDEIEVEAFLKLMLAKGGRIEIYSAHDYPDTKYGRGK